MALIVRNLSKRYGAQPALQGIDLDLSEGVVALLGANGSGKSTLLRILATLCKPDTGALAFNEWRYGQDERFLRAFIGYLPQDFEVPESLTPRKFLRYLASLRGGDIHQVCDRLQLNTIADQPFHKLSGGQIRLVGFAQALLGNPQLLLLDELSRGLDLVERTRIYKALARYSNLIIFSTHLPQEAEQIAQNVIVLHKGRVLFCGTPDELRACANDQVYEIRLPTEILPQVPESTLISRMISEGPYSLVRSVGKPLSQKAIIVEPSLEDAYLLLTHHANHTEIGKTNITESLF